MLEGLRSYLLSVTAAALLIAIVQSALPQGPTQRVSSMACALLLFICVIRPLNHFDAQQLADDFQQYCQELTAYPDEIVSAGDVLTESIILERSQAYIKTKAEEKGIVCDVQVMCESQQGIAVPSYVTVSGPLSAGQQKEIITVIKEGFGLSAEQVCFTKE